MKLTNEQLSALPERKETEVRFLTEAEAIARGGRLGDSEIFRISPKFRQYRMKPDDVWLFTDADGSWFVEYHLEGGPYKRRA
ncbi:MAG: hypothetical protein H7Z19_08245 [Chitinophagaceae bacterium]|nr:hypothetical protein [Rubrivivax sp.]